MVDTDRNTSSVINNGNGIIRINRNLNRITKARKRFIHRIIYNFINQMVQTSAGGSSDIHTGTFSDRFQSLQNLNLVGAVFMLNRRIVHGFFTHLKTSFSFLFIHAGNNTICHPEYFIDFKPVIYKFFQSGTGNNRLDIPDAV